MKLASLVNLKPLKEGAFGMAAKELAATYSLERLQSIRDEIMGDMEQEAEPEGGRIADMYADQLHGLDQAIAIKRGDSGTPLTYDQAIGRVSKDQFNKSSKFDRMNEATEKAWNAVDVSRKAEKEIGNKEWNERTTKKLDMLKALNSAGKFKKDWDEEKLQGWVDQNYSWEKLSRQFKLNEVYSSMYSEVDSEPDYEWEKGSKAGPSNPKYDASTEKSAQDTSQGNTHTVELHVDGAPTQVTIQSMGIEGKPVTISWGDESHTVKFEYHENLGGSEAYDECNTVIYEAYSEDDKWRFLLPVCVDPNPNNEEIWDYEWHELEISIDDNMREDFTFEPEDMDNPDEDLVIIGSGYLDIKSNFGERPSQTNGEYAALGQKVVDQLHNGDKEAALDYIYSKINEGSCGYSQEAPGGKDLKTPGGTKGIPADKRTMGMMRETIRKEIKKLSEEGSLDKNLKGEFSPEEWEKITSKKVPSFADMKPKDDREGPDHGKTQTSPSGTKFRKWDKKTDMMGNPRGTKRKDKNMQGGPLRKGNVNYRGDETK